MKKRILKKRNKKAENTKLLESIRDAICRIEYSLHEMKQHTQWLESIYSIIKYRR